MKYGDAIQSRLRAELIKAREFIKKSAEAEEDKKPGRDLHRLDAVESLRSFAQMQAEPVRQAACAVVAEISRTFAHEGQADEDTFRLVGAVLDAIESGRDPWPD